MKLTDVMLSQVIVESGRSGADRSQHAQHRDRAGRLRAGCAPTRRP